MLVFLVAIYHRSLIPNTGKITVWGDLGKRKSAQLIRIMIQFKQWQGEEFFLPNYGQNFAIFGLSSKFDQFGTFEDQKSFF